MANGSGKSGLWTLVAVGVTLFLAAVTGFKSYGVLEEGQRNLQHQHNLLCQRMERVEDKIVGKPRYDSEQAEYRRKMEELNCGQVEIKERIIRLEESMKYLPAKISGEVVRELKKGNHVNGD